jgi:hypothetical protein
MEDAYTVTFPVARDESNLTARRFDGQTPDHL